MDNNKPLFMFKHTNGMVSVIQDEQQAASLRRAGVKVDRIIVVDDDVPNILPGRQGIPTWKQLIHVWNCIVLLESQPNIHGDKLAEAERTVRYGGS